VRLARSRLLQNVRSRDHSSEDELSESIQPRAYFVIATRASSALHLGGTEMSIVQRYDYMVRHQLPASAIRLANNPRNVLPFEPSGSAVSSVAGRTEVSEGPGQSG
jgi:hypothetical protein